MRHIERVEWVTVQVRWSHSKGGGEEVDGGDDDEEEEAYLDGMRRVMGFGASLVVDMLAWLLLGGVWVVPPKLSWYGGNRCRLCAVRIGICSSDWLQSSRLMNDGCVCVCVCVCVHSSDVDDLPVSVFQCCEIVRSSKKYLPVKDDDHKCCRCVCLVY